MDVNTLTIIDLSHSNIQLNDNYLVEKFKNNNIVMKLNLHDNKIDLVGIQIIIEFIKQHPTLQILYLGKNNIGVEGVKLLSEFLKTNNSITYIDLSGNKIYSEGVKYLSVMLQSNQTLKTLNLMDNGIDDEGCEFLLNSVGKNLIIEAIYLSCNKIENILNIHKIHRHADINHQYNVIAKKFKKKFLHLAVVLIRRDIANNMYKNLLRQVILVNTINSVGMSSKQRTLIISKINYLLTQFK